MCVLWACCPFSMCFTVSYESKVGLDHKAHPVAFKARTPGYCCSQLYLLLLLLFRPKTERAAQTVRARELKFGQLVVVVAGTSNPKARPCRLIGGATEQSTRFQTFLALARKPIVENSKTLHFGILGSIKTKWLSPISFPPRLFLAAILKFVQHLLLRTSPRFFAQSEPNHCRNVLCRVNINNHWKKVEISTHVWKGA